MTSEIERKLAIILSADVYGFSRLMSRDEAGTLATLSAYRATVTGLIERHQGRLVNSAGDSLLAEFASPVMAMQCAVAIQREIGERNGKLPPDQQMWFRIGINLGDVMVERDDIFGDDVNIAARLQGMAEPGGIMISGTVFDQVKHKVTLGFDFLGPQHLKNIAAEVPVYRAVLKPDVTPPPPAGEPAPGSAPPSPEEKRRRLMMSGVRAERAHPLPSLDQSLLLGRRSLVPVAGTRHRAHLRAARDGSLGTAPGPALQAERVSPALVSTRSAATSQTLGIRINIA